MTTAIKGNDTSTFGGAITANNVGAGNVLQVIHSNFTSAISTTSSSLVTTGYSASITPSSTSNKIIVMFGFTGGNNTNTGSGIRLGIYRGATNLTGTTGYFTWTQTSGVSLGTAINYVDSPATTSATTYTIYYGASNGTAYMQANGTSDFPAMLILMEVAG